MTRGDRLGGNSLGAKCFVTLLTTCEAGTSNQSVILLPAHPASFAHKFLFQRVPASPGMQWYCRLVIKNSI